MSGFHDPNCKNEKLHSVPGECQMNQQLGSTGPTKEGFREKAWAVEKQFPLLDDTIGAVTRRWVIEQALQQAFQAGEESGIRKAADICDDFKTVPNCNMKDHDPRWCARCTDMDDAADIIQDKILALLSEGKK